VHVCSNREKWEITLIGREKPLFPFSRRPEVLPYSNGEKQGKRKKSEKTALGGASGVLRINRTERVQIFLEKAENNESKLSGTKRGGGNRSMTGDGQKGEEEEGKREEECGRR